MFTVAGVVSDNHGAVRGVESYFIIAGPDDFIGIQANIGEGVDGMYGVAHYFITAILQTVIIVNIGGVAVRIVNIANVFFFPNAVGNADNVINDVNVGIFEPAH